jgi:polysaccharide pyruvyl transferase WcaK-like protein
MGNLGDDAMFEAICRLLPDRHLITFALPDQESYLGHLGLSGRSYFDSIILGGGTLINPAWLEAVTEAARKEVPLYTFGTGVGSCGFEQPDGVDVSEWRSLLGGFARLGVRGPRSKRSLEALGLRNAEVVGDLALSLTSDRAVEPAKDPPQVALNIAMPSGQDYDAPANAFLSDVATAVRRLVKQGWQVVPFAMASMDTPPVTRFLQEVDLAHLPVPVLTTTRQFFDLIAPCTFTIAVRLHGAILSTCIGVPPLMLGYRDKCLDFMESVELTEWHIALGDAAPGEISDRTARLAEVAPSLRADVLARSQRWRRKLESYARDCFAAPVR